MKKKMAIVTATRAEYSLLKPIIKLMKKEEFIDIELVVTGAHLSPEFGCTYQEIEKDNIKIDKKIEMLVSSDSAVGMSKSMALAMIGFAEYCEEQKPDIILVIGDRYEMMAVCCAAMNACIPIIHLYGGDTTEGAIDEAIRHSISKMSYLHFTSTEKYRQRVIQLGESPDRVFCVGALGVENAMNIKKLSKKELETSLGVNLHERIALVTFHPVTLERNSAEKQAVELAEAMKTRTDIDFIVTKANADTEGRIINSIIEQYAKDNNHILLFDSLGSQRYLSLMAISTFVLGNSSSGLVEAPIFKIPTINIGNRQRGRIQPASVLNCIPNKEKILEAMDIATSQKFRDSIVDIQNPYGDGQTSKKIVSILKERILDNNISVDKKFYDLV